MSQPLSNFAPQPTNPPAPGAGEPWLPLALIRPGETVEMAACRGGLGLRRRLAELGVGPGARFRVESSGRRGPCVIVVKGARMLLGHGMVSRIFVRRGGCPR